MMHNLLLMVKNSNALERGTLPSHVFSHKGGRVGSCERSEWRIDNYEQNIDTTLFTIEYINGEYCLTANAKSIFINNNKKDLKKNSTIRIKCGDFININKYILHAKIITDQADMMTYESNLLGILGYKESLLLSDSDNIQKKPKYKNTEEEILTIENHYLSKDPIELLSKEEKNDKEILLSFYDDLQIIPQKNLNLSDEEFFGHDSARTNLNIIPSFLPRRIHKNILNTNIAAQEKLIDIKPIVKIKKDQQILDPLILLGNPESKE